MIPIQYRSIDPGSSFDSDNTNKISRIISCGQDKILKKEYLYPTLIGPDTVSITPGICIKDDVVIELVNTNTICINDKSGNAYSNIDGTIPSNAAVKVVYIVLKYVYEKKKISNQAELKFFLNTDSFRINGDAYNYLFLGCANYTVNNGVYTLSNLRTSDLRARILDPVDGGIYPTDYYTDYVDGGSFSTTVYDETIDGTSFIYNDSADLVVIEERQELSNKKQILIRKEILSGDISFSLTHNLKSMPLVQVLDATTKELYTSNYSITHIDDNTFVIGLNQAKDIIVIYS